MIYFSGKKIAEQRELARHEYDGSKLWFPRAEMTHGRRLLVERGITRGEEEGRITGL